MKVWPLKITIISGKITADRGKDEFLRCTASMRNLKGCTSIVIKTSSQNVEQITPKKDTCEIDRMRATKPSSFSSICSSYEQNRVNIRLLFIFSWQKAGDIIFVDDICVGDAKGCQIKCCSWRIEHARTWTPLCRIQNIYRLPSVFSTFFYFGQFNRLTGKRKSYEKIRGKFYKMYKGSQTMHVIFLITFLAKKSLIRQLGRPIERKSRIKSAILVST